MAGMSAHPSGNTCWLQKRNSRLMHEVMIRGQGGRGGGIYTHHLIFGMQPPRMHPTHVTPCRAKEGEKGGETYGH